MNNSVLIAFVVLFIHTLYSVSFGEPQFEIHDGNCTKLVDKDLVMNRHVHLSRIPLMTRQDKETWHGDYRIYCIIANSLKAQEKGSTVNITEGGWNHTFVTLDLKSASGHGLEYMLYVYANTSTTVKLY